MRGTALFLELDDQVIHFPPLSVRSCVADGLAYSALLKNELLGAGIDKVQDPQSEDRRLQTSTPVKRSLFSVGGFQAGLISFSEE